MTISKRFGFPFFTGGSATISASAVTPFDVVINGRGYMIDWTMPYKYDSIPLLRNLYLQERSTGPIGETSLNPDDYWRRSVDDWSAGAGQLWADHTDSVSNRYESSKGIDPWTKGEATLLHDAAQVLPAGTYPGIRAVVAGNYLYFYTNFDGIAETLDKMSVLDGSDVGPVTATGGDAAISGFHDITTDGYTIWVSDGTRTHYTLRGTSTFTKWHTSDHAATLLRAAKSRLFSAIGTTLYTHTMTAGSSVATSYFVHNSPDWRWTDVAGGPDAVYFSGYAGTHSAIYAATLKDDASTLDPPVVVATMPTGEIVRAMCCYLGVMVIGTDKGWRIASIGTGGSLTLGALVEMDNPPICFEPQDRFVWYGWTNYDTGSTGLGRMDLSTFNDTTPAYASDLMADGSGTINSVVTWQGRTTFAVEGKGIYVASATDYVAEGTLTSGRFDYTLADAKVAIKCNVQYRKGEGTIALAVTADDANPLPVGTTIVTSATAGDQTKIVLPQLVAHAYDLTFTLTRTDADATPVLDRHTLMVEPQPERRFLITCPLKLFDEVTNHTGVRQHIDPIAERAIYKNLISSASVIPFQDSEVTLNVMVEDMSWVPYQVLQPERTWNGCLTLMLKEIS